MATTLQLRRGTAIEAAAFTGADGELYVDMTNKKVYLHDGVTQGGHPVDTTLDEALLMSKQDGLESGTNIKTINGSTLLGAGNIVLNTLPSTTTELTNGLYSQPLSFTASCALDNGNLKGTFTGSINNQMAIDDLTLHAFGKSLHTTSAYQIFIGDQPPLTVAWNLPNDELDRTFLCVTIDRTTEVDNGNGTFTYTCNFLKASIPSAFVNGVPTSWITMDGAQLTQALNAQDVIGNDVLTGQPIVLVTGSAQYAQLVHDLLVDLSCFSKYTSIMHLVAASLGDFIQ